MDDIVYSVKHWLFIFSYLFLYLIKLKKKYKFKYLSLIELKFKTMMKVISKYNFSLGEVVTIIITIAFLSVILIINISEQIAFH